MKEGWEYRKLKEICSSIEDGDWIESKDQSPNGIRLIQTGNIGNGSYKDKKDSAKYISEETFKRLHCTEIFKGDILVSRLPDPVGRACTLPDLGCRCITAVDCSVLKIKKDFVCNAWITYYMQSQAYFTIIKSQCTGSTRLRITRKKLAETQIPVPPLSEQQRIVDYLDSAFAKIDAMKANAEKALNEAKALFQASLKEMLEPKDGWEENTINDIAIFRNGVAHEKDIEKGGNYIVINSKFVATEGTIRKYTNEQLSPLYTNEIVMVMSDVPKGKTLAKCYIIECDNKYSLNQRICAFKSKGLDVRFLYYLLNRNPNLLKYDNGENQTNLRKNQILECPVAYPAQKNEQQSIVEKLDSLKSKVDRLQENYNKISQECDVLKQAILRQVFE